MITMLFNIKEKLKIAFALEKKTLLLYTLGVDVNMYS
jgi:hypothetical protein